MWPYKPTRNKSTMSIETPNQSSGKQVSAESLTSAELRDMHHIESNAKNTDSDSESLNTDNVAKKRVVPFSEKFLNTRPKQVGAGLFAAALAIGVPTAIAQNIERGAVETNDQNNSDPTVNSSETSAPVEVSPSASPTNLTPLETTPATPAFELDASMTEKELAMNIVGLFDEWNSASTSPEIHTAWDRMTTVEDYAADIAAKNTSIYAKKLFGADYATRMTSDPIFKTFVEGMQRKNAENIVAFIRTDNTGVNTQDQNPNNIEPWEQKINFEEVASYTVLNGYHQLIINCTETDNREFNLYGITPKENPNETLTVTYLKEDSGVTLTRANFAAR